MEFDVVERGDSSLGDEAGLDGSSEAEMLFTMLRGMWTKPSKKQTEKTMEDCKIDDNGDELLAEKKKHRGKRKWPTEPSTKGKLNAPRNHMIDVASHRIPKTADLGAQVLLVVNSFKLHLTAFNARC